MSSFKQTNGHYRLRITSAFLPVELTCARMRSVVSVPASKPVVSDPFMLAFPIGISFPLTDKIALDLAAFRR